MAKIRNPVPPPGVNHTVWHTLREAEIRADERERQVPPDALEVALRELRAVDRTELEHVASSLSAAAALLAQPPPQLADSVDRVERQRPGANEHQATAMRLLAQVALAVATEGPAV